MSIRRGKRPDTRFYTLNKDISEDVRLSWAARGMLIFLLGKPDNWTVSVAHLMKQTGSSARPSSRDAVRAIIKELVDAGYMRADTAREGGKFKGIDYVVSESPETDNPAPAKPQPPETDNPAPDEPLPEDPQVIKNELHQGMKNPPSNDLVASQNCAAPGVSLPDVLPEQKQPTPEEKQQADQTAFQEKCRATWKAYREGYEQQHGAVPVRNQKVNALVKQLVQRLGEEAPDVASFYVLSVKEAYVVKRLHPLEALVKDAEAYRTQWFTGHAMTSGRARQIDSTQTNASAADEATAMLRAQREREGRA